MDNKTLKKHLKKGDIICYRVNLVKILKIDDDGCLVRGHYGEEQHIDWDDIREYNREFRA